MNNITAEEVTTLTTKLIDKAYKEGESTALDEVLEIIEKYKNFPRDYNPLKYIRNEIIALKEGDPEGEQAEYDEKVAAITDLINGVPSEDSEDAVVDRVLEQDPCEDAISRQAVLSYIYNDLGLGDEENGADVERQIELERSYKYIKSLPHVTPHPKKGGDEE